MVTDRLKNDPSTIRGSFQEWKQLQEVKKQNEGNPNFNYDETVKQWRDTANNNQTNLDKEKASIRANMDAKSAGNTTGSFQEWQQLQKVKNQNESNPNFNYEIPLEKWRAAADYNQSRGTNNSNGYGNKNSSNSNNYAYNGNRNSSYGNSYNSYNSPYSNGYQRSSPFGRDSARYEQFARDSYRSGTGLDKYFERMGELQRMRTARQWT